jgi:bifunctional enzyme CysN/CysC
LGKEVLTDIPYPAIPVRRLSEIAHILVDAGAILLVTAIELNQNDYDIIKAVINPEKVSIVGMGKEVTTDINYDIHIIEIETPDIETKQNQGITSTKRCDL